MKFWGTKLSWGTGSCQKMGPAVSWVGRAKVCHLGGTAQFPREKTLLSLLIQCGKLVSQVQEWASLLIFCSLMCRLQETLADPCLFLIFCFQQMENSLIRKTLRHHHYHHPVEVHQGFIPCNHPFLPRQSLQELISKHLMKKKSFIVICNLVLTVDVCPWRIRTIVSTAWIFRQLFLPTII